MDHRFSTRLVALVLASLLVAPGLASGQTQQAPVQASPTVEPARAGGGDAGADLGVILRDLSQEIRALRTEVRDLREEMKLARERPAAPAAAAPAAARPADRVYEIALAADDRTKGDDGARFALVEYSDFQCPFCNRFHADAYPEIAERYVDTGKLRYVFRDFPLDFHRKAMGAHVAAHCADRQGRFWDMHHALFENQKALGPDLYATLAAQLELDTAAFTTCVQDPAVAAQVEKEKEGGKGHGVRGTPTFFLGEIEDGKVVNARRLSGAQPFEAFARAIDAVMAGDAADTVAAAASPPAAAAAAAPPATAPAAPRPTTIALGASERVKGDPGAMLALVEYSDFQCPFCNRFHTQTFPKLLETYVDTGKLRYVYKDFPLSFHAQAESAHIAAECAGRQRDDAYWDMHHGLFTNQKQLGPALYERLASAQGLDMDRFRSCLGDPAVASALAQEVEEGRGHGVRGTPTFFLGEVKDGTLVDATRISGAQPFASFARAIDAALARLQTAEK